MQNHKAWNFFIAKEGISFLIPSILVTIFFGLMGWDILLFLGIILSVFIVFFFRNPSRTIPPAKDAIVAPADGRIVEINQCEEKDFLKDRTLKLSIFMSLFDVHINRAPTSGKVIEIKHRPGRFMMANMDKSSQLNEQNAILIETDDNMKILLVQVAGFIARRIVCYLNPGDILRKGEIFGMIQFGSRIDLYLPTRFKPAVRLGDHVKGGESIIGYLT